MNGTFSLSSIPQYAYPVVRAGVEWGGYQVLDVDTTDACPSMRLFRDARCPIIKHHFCRIPIMRTTLDIDEDVLFAAKDVARRDKRTMGQVVSELMRRALSGPIVVEVGSSAEKPSGDGIDGRFRAMGFRTLPARGGIVTNELINQLRERDGI